jgi:protein-arginine kinase activator protein McsA
MNNHKCDLCSSGDDLIEIEQLGENGKNITRLCRKCYLKLRLTMKCKNCGIMISDFERTGLVGCARCYDDLTLFLDPLIIKVQDL